MGKGNFEKLMQILTEWCKTKSKIIMTAANQNKIKLNTRSSIHWKLRVKWLQLISHLHLVRWEGDIHSLNYSQREIKPLQFQTSVDTKSKTTLSTTKHWNVLALPPRGGEGLPKTQGEDAGKVYSALKQNIQRYSVQL